MWPPSDNLTLYTLTNYISRKKNRFEPRTTAFYRRSVTDLVTEIHYTKKYLPLRAHLAAVKCIGLSLTTTVIAGIITCTNLQVSLYLPQLDKVPYRNPLRLQFGFDEDQPFNHLRGIFKLSGRLEAASTGEGGAHERDGASWNTLRGRGKRVHVKTVM